MARVRPQDRRASGDRGATSRARTTPSDRSRVAQADCSRADSTRRARSRPTPPAPAGRLQARPTCHCDLTRVRFGIVQSARMRRNRRRGPSRASAHRCTCRNFARRPERGAAVGRVGDAAAWSRASTSSCMRTWSRCSARSTRRSTGSSAASAACATSRVSPTSSAPSSARATSSRA